MLADRPGRMLSSRQVARIDETRSDLRGLAFGVPRQIVSGSLVGTSLSPAADSIGVHEGVVPDLAAFS
ncbi:MAG: hypothetical protein P4L85_02640 [Paludisphaera borealis]|uniref:hypothetical protein n=1 Tax=Paludisphaera borealis TaxID=1387353 RepID=UPI00283D48B9|nr:hypothetical protein [Paludisphaera borealis]MDR3618219.1 hypothetical protein [Paludisphaera borealis]